MDDALQLPPLPYSVAALLLCPDAALPPTPPDFRRWELYGAPYGKARPCQLTSAFALTSSPCPHLPPFPRLVHAAQPWLHPSRSPAKISPPVFCRPVCPASLPPRLPLL